MNKPEGVPELTDEAEVSEGQKKTTRDVIPLPVEWHGPGLMEGETRIKGLTRLDWLDKRIQELQDDIDIMQGGIVAAEEHNTQAEEYNKYLDDQSKVEKVGRYALNKIKKITRGSVQIRPVMNMRGLGREDVDKIAEETVSARKELEQLMLEKENLERAIYIPEVLAELRETEKKLNRPMRIEKMEANNETQPFRWFIGQRFKLRDILPAFTSQGKSTASLSYLRNYPLLTLTGFDSGKVLIETGPGQLFKWPLETLHEVLEPIQPEAVTNSTITTREKPESPEADFEKKKIVITRAPGGISFREIFESNFPDVPESHMLAQYDYMRWLIKNSDKAPSILKDFNYYYFPEFDAEGNLKIVHGMYWSWVNGGQWVQGTNQPESVLHSTSNFLVFIEKPESGDKGFENRTADEFFKVDTSDKARIKIFGLGSNFENIFIKPKLEMGEVMPTSAMVLKYQMTSKEIIEQIGRERVETSLMTLWHMLEGQRNGEKGTLLTNGFANIFFIRGADGNLWAVYAFWYAEYGGWYVSAYSVEDPYRWSAGSQVVSRN